MNTVIWFEALNGRRSRQPAFPESIGLAILEDLIINYDLILF